jgi:hypothetical protein
MRVGPPHRSLEHVVQLRQPDAAQDQNTSPDHRVDILEKDPQLEDRLTMRSRTRGRHPRTRRRPSEPLPTIQVRPIQA